LIGILHEALNLPRGASSKATMPTSRSDAPTSDAQADGEFVNNRFAAPQMEGPNQDDMAVDDVI